MSVKKFLSISIGVIVVATTFIACNINSSNTLENQLTIENVKLAHRVAMENAFHSFEPSEEITHLSGKIDFISDFNKKSLQELKVSQNIYNQLSEAIDLHKSFVVGFEYESPFTKQKINTDDPFIAQEVALNDFENSGLFSIEEIDLMRKTSNLFKDSIFLTSMADSLEKYKDEYLELDYNSEGSYFQTGLILAIAEESYYWWTENPEAAFDDPTKLNSENIQAVLPGLIATDAAGAIVGGAIAAGGQLIFSDDFNWGVVGYGAVAGAIVGSTGAVGRLAGWLSKL